MGKNRSKSVRRLAPAEHRRFEKHYRQHYGAVQGCFLRKGFREEEAKDLTQETFLRAYRGFDDFRRESSFLTWALVIAEKIAINQHRFKGAEMRSAPEVAINALEDDGEAMLGARADNARPVTPEEHTLSREKRMRAEENRRRLRVAMDELPPQMRHCILMYIYQGKKYREIAVLLDVSINTVKSQIFQAKKRLRVLLDDLAADLDASQ